MEIGTIFNKSQYDEAYAFVSKNIGLTIKEVEPRNEIVKKTRQIEKTGEEGHIYYEDEEYEEEELVRYYQIMEIPAPTTEELSAQKRAERDSLLASTDKYMLPDFPITEEERAQYKAYRQYLRDLPESWSFPNVEIMTFEQYVESITKGE